ncbi:hypothetical protein Tco_0158265 [Tanacetum coccineum]
MKKENMSIEEMMREQLMVDDEIKGISNYLSYKRFRGEKIDDEYERACEIKIGQLLQDYNVDYRMVVKEIEDGLLEEMEKFGWWFEQDIYGEYEDDNENKLVMVQEVVWLNWEMPA